MGRTGSKPPESDTNWPTYANCPNLRPALRRALRDAFRRYTARVTNGDRPNSPKPTDRALVRRAQETRERVIARLSDHFAHDTLDVDEFERRVTVAQTSDNPADIEALLADLPDTGVAPAPTTAMVPTVVPAAGAAGTGSRHRLRDLRRHRSPRDLERAAPDAHRRDLRRRQPGSARGALPARRHRHRGDGRDGRHQHRRAARAGGPDARLGDHGRVRGREPLARLPRSGRAAAAHSRPDDDGRREHRDAACRARASAAPGARHRRELREERREQRRLDRQR